MQRGDGGKSMGTRSPGPSGQLAFRPLLVAVLVFLVAAAVATALIWRLERYRLQEEKARVASVAGDYAYDLQRRLDQAFSATYALAALVRQGHGAIAEFDAVARQMLSSYPGVAALQLAPGGVIRQIVPLEGNEKAIGHDLLKNSARNKEALLARDTGKLTLAGPFELIQGGVGAVARLPVFLDDRQGHAAFWGFTNVLVRFPQVLDQALLSQLTKRGFAFELWRIHPDSRKRQVIAASSAALLSKPVERVLNVPNGTWTLSMVPVKGWGDPVGLAFKAALGLLFSLLFAWLAKLLVKSRLHETGLEALVAERTVALEMSVKAVRDELDARNLAEESLQRQKKFTENLIENSAAATFVLDTQHQVILWNKACEELTGIAAAAMIGTDEHWQAFYDYKRPCLSDIVLDADSDRLPGLYTAYAKSTLVTNGLHAEGWYENLNGKSRYIMFDAAPVYDNKGNLLAAIETIQDTTELRRADEALSENAERMAVILDGINALIYVADMETYEILFVNKFGRDIWGEIVGKTCWKVLQAGQSGPCPFCTNDRLLTADGVPTGVYAWEFQNTITGCWYDCRDQAIRWSDGRLVRMEIATDITEYRKLEAQLHHTQKMESIGTLAGGIAHDFNNILTAIIGYGSLALMKMAADDPHRLYIQHMLEASDRAARLTRDLLLFSRKQTIDKKMVDLNLVVAKVKKFLNRVIGEDITCQTSLLAAPLLVLADDYQLEQVLMNLATNARDAMPHGGSLTVTTEHVVLNGEFVSAHGFGKPGPYALLTVTDTGTGMDEVTRLRIFEPFFTTKEVGKGTGLGLAVTYGIIKQHDGYINVYSEPGTGTTFRIYLPIIPAEAGGEHLPQPEEVPASGTETILLAEDDASVREMTGSLLTEFGYTVIAAVDGADAVQKFVEHNETVDLLLFDLIMPKMNGKEALDEIRKVRSGIKVIFSSGYAPDTIRQKALFAEGVYLIAKPMLPKELLRKVRRVLDEVEAK